MGSPACWLGRHVRRQLAPLLLAGPWTGHIHPGWVDRTKAVLMLAGQAPGLHPLLRQQPGHGRVPLLEARLLAGPPGWPALPHLRPVCGGSGALQASPQWHWNLEPKAVDMPSICTTLQQGAGLNQGQLIHQVPWLTPHMGTAKPLGRYLQALAPGMQAASARPCSRGQ